MGRFDLIRFSESSQSAIVNNIIIVSIDSREWWLMLRVDD